MALLAIDGFAGNPSRYMSGVLLSSTQTAPRTPGGWKASVNNPRRRFTPTAEVFAGVGIFQTGTSAANVSLWGDDGATQHLTVVVNSIGHVELRRGGTALAGGTLLATGGTPIPPNSWLYVELHATIADAGGIAQVRINGESINEIDYTGDTRNGGTGTDIDAIAVGTLSAADFFADLYVADTTGSVSNSWLGDVAVSVLVPTGAGVSSGLTNSSATAASNNWSFVDEIPANSSDYVGSATTGAKDTYAISAMPAGAIAVKGIAVSATMAKSDASFKESRVVVRSGGADFDGPLVTLTTSYADATVVHTVDPATSAAWTLGGVAALQAGMKVG